MNDIQITLSIPWPGLANEPSIVELLFQKGNWFMLHHQSGEALPFQSQHLIGSLVFFDVTYKQFLNLLKEAMGEYEGKEIAIESFPFEVCLLHALRYGFFTTGEGYAFMAMHWLGGDDFPITMDIYALLIDISKQEQTERFNLQEMANTILQTEGWS